MKTLSPFMSRRTAAQSMAGIFALALSAALLMACSPEKPQFKSIDLTGADYAQGFSLLDQNGQRRMLSDFAGKIVVVFFGYTQCPDVCPATLTELVQVKQLLGPDGDRLQAIFITVDPERDTPELLKAYMGNFDPGFVALRPTVAELPEVARAFKIYYKKAEGKTPGSYSMDHSAGSYVFDGKGRVRLYSRYGAGAQALASDIRLLLKNT
jgi:protein SCO1/2